MQQEIKKKSQSECGRLGALALNSNPEKKRAAIMKAVQTCLAKDPDYYSKKAKLGAGKPKKRHTESTI